MQVQVGGRCQIKVEVGVGTNTRLRLGSMSNNLEFFEEELNAG